MQKQGITPQKKVVGAVRNSYKYKGTDYLEIFDLVHSELQPFTMQFWRNVKYLTHLEGFGYFRERVRLETGFRIGHNAMYLGVRGEHSRYQLMYLQVIARSLGYSFVDLLTRDIQAEQGVITLPRRTYRKKLKAS